MTLFTDYLAAKGATRYQLAKENNMKPSSFQRVKDTDNIFDRILKIIAGN